MIFRCTCILCEDLTKESQYFYVIDLISGLSQSFRKKMAELVEIRPKSAGRQDSLHPKPLDRRYRYYTKLECSAVLGGRRHDHFPQKYALDLKNIFVVKINNSINMSATKIRLCYDMCNAIDNQRII
jgi:hypothetical protein